MRFRLGLETSASRSSESAAVGSGRSSERLGPRGPAAGIVSSPFTIPIGRAVLIASMLATAVPRADAQLPSGEEASRLEEQGIAFFESRIRPVLIDHCYACHNSADNAEAGLAVDSREALRKGGEGGPLIVPGDPTGSRLMAILRHEIEGLEMPQDGPKLGRQVIADFSKWIAIGAPDPRDSPAAGETLEAATSWAAKLERRKQWWCFQPISDPPMPPPNEWSDHPIDRFIHAGLTEAGLSPAPPADPEVLIRRLFINLVGLPPGTDQLRNWVDRYESVSGAERDIVTAALVDELLSSVHFGERWARHWMDWIRYAESHGSEGDPRIDGAWRYRDYLIRALNDDIPYDQLVREHLAGDLLENPRINSELQINESLIGPAHLRMVFHGFAPTDALDEKVRFIDDQINAVSKAFLGLTVSCARCHDHKFDAISQADYYAWFGIFGSCRPGRAVIDVAERQRAGFDELSELKTRVRAAVADDWHATLESPSAWITVDDPRVTGAKTPTDLLYPIRQLIDSKVPFSKAWQDLVEAAEQPAPAGPDEVPAPAGRDEVIVAWDLSSDNDYQDWTRSGIGLADRPSEAGTFAISAEGQQALTGIYPSGVYSHRVSAKHAARLTSDDIDLNQPAELWVRAIGDGNSTLRYVVRDYPRNGTVYPVTNLKPQWTWQRYDLTYWEGDSIHIELTGGQDAPLLVRGDSRSWFGVTEARLVKPGSPRPHEQSPILSKLRETDPDRRPASVDDVINLYRVVFVDAVSDWRQGLATDAQAELLDAGMRAGLLPNTLDGLPSAKSLIESYRRIEAEIPDLRRVPALEETNGRTQPLFIRGNHKQPGEIVPRRFLEAIDPTPYSTSESGRLELAEDLLREDNPLTRRVIVNRLWHHLFGRGIVATPDNFGRLGQEPSHPELLDYLANQLADRGWSLKQMIRLMVTSHSWQLASTPPSGADENDPDNALLSHANVRRMEAEAIRDSLMAVSGQLDRAAFGPPAGNDSNRRSIYLPVIRNSLHPFLRAFDFPEPFSATGRRDVTNVPAQSLTMMNDSRVANHARAFALSIINQDELSDDPARIRQMFLTAFARKPTAKEIEETQAYLASTRQAYTELRLRASTVRSKLGQEQSRIDSILRPATAQLRADRLSGSQEIPADLPEPIASWEFDGTLEDSVGGHHGKAQGNARLEGGVLVTGGRAHVVTSPLNQSISEKTLEAWVQLDDLGQRGGGVISVQTPDGSRFDSLVFGEQEPGRWLAGSEFFNRTRGFGGPVEGDAEDRFVHLAVCYHSDGRIVAYRDGEPYGRGYSSNGPMRFDAGESIVSFGVRHLPAVGNRVLAGRIDRARLYDHALSAAEVAASYAFQGPSITERQVLESLAASERQQVKASRQKIRQLEAELESIGSIPETAETGQIWIDLAHSLFTFKEFMYVR